MAILPPEAALIFAEVAARFNELEAIRPGLGIQLARRLERIATTSAVGFKNLCSLAAGDGIARQSLDRRAKIVGVSKQAIDTADQLASIRLAIAGLDPVALTMEEMQRRPIAPEIVQYNDSYGAGIVHPVRPE